MKKVALLFVVTTLIVSCNQTAKEKQNTETSESTAQISDSEAVHQTDQQTGFNIEEVPYSKADIGVFPFFTLPEGLSPLNKPIEREFDVIYFPIDEKMTPLEGKVYKANISSENRKAREWSLAYFLKSYDEAITAVGGKKIFEGQISKEEYNRFSEKATYLGEGGSIGYTKETISVYVIRREDGKNIYIQVTGNTAGGKLNILQETGFKQTISKVTADDIVKDLTEKGKSILYINFDIDQSNLTSDGKEIVSEIAEALKKDKTVKITIEGHTDNTGDAAHNTKLSNDRAHAVLNTLVSHNIDKSRLQAKGFGAERPLVANDSEDNKAKNRRVELVKTK